MPNHPVQNLRIAKVADLSWLAGKWLGTKESDQIEEHWSAPAANAMMGMFRWFNAQGVRFYELIALEQELDGVVMRIKHFHPGLKGWEEKDQSVELWLTALDATKAIFSKANSSEPKWLVYEMISPNEILAYFDTPQSSGREKPFHYFLK